MIHRQLVFPHEVWERCRRSLFNPDQQENFLFGLARPCRRMNGIAYLVEQLLDPGQNGYCHRSVGGLTLTEAMSNRLNIVSQRAAAVGLVPVHLHSHPSGLSCFSHYDDRKEQDLHQWLVAQDQPLLWSLVWAYGGEPEARLWIGGKTEAGTVRAGLRVFGNSTASTAPALERQRAFGEGLRQATAVL